MNLQQCISYMEQHCPKGSSGGLKRTRKMAAIYGNPQDELQIIHVAGTNGKGSTCAMLNAILQEAGYRVGLYTSPHLERYNERIQINGNVIEDNAFSDILTELIVKVIPLVEESGLGHPGEFELLTVAGWIYFAGKTDFVISEVGLGGQLDPTNLVLRPIITVITSISLDHCAILGNTVAEIAEEKAGIMKAGAPLIVSIQSSEAETVLRKRADELKVDSVFLQESELKRIATNLCGYYQQLNANTALAVINKLKSKGVISISEEQISVGFQKVKWPGRMEYIPMSANRGILMDGAHNPDGIMRLCQSLRQDYVSKEIVLFLGILDDKDQTLMLQNIVPMASKVIITHPNVNNRAQHWQELAVKVKSVAPDCTCIIENSLNEGLFNAVCSLQDNQLLCITGSLYLIGDCRQILKQMNLIDIPS